MKTTDHHATLVEGRASQASPLTLAHARPRANTESAEVKSGGCLQGRRVHRELWAFTKKGKDGVGTGFGEMAESR